MRTLHPLLAAALLVGFAAARRGGGSPTTQPPDGSTAAQELSACLEQINAITSSCPCEECTDGSPPSTCLASCAEVFQPFYEQCESVLMTVDSLSREISKLEALYATCQEVDLDAGVVPVCSGEGTWQTDFGEIQVRGERGSLLGVWGDLYDIAWRDSTHLEGTFRDAVSADAAQHNSVGRFIFSFGRADCHSFTGQWGWELDSTMDGDWNGEWSSADTPLSPDEIDAETGAGLADLFAFTSATSIEGWQQSDDADWGWGGDTAADFEYSRAHECGLFHGTIDTTGTYPYSLVTSPDLTGPQKAELAAAEGMELCIEELLPDGPRIFTLQVNFHGWVNSNQAVPDRSIPTKWMGSFTAPTGNVERGSDCDGGILRVPWDVLVPRRGSQAVDGVPLGSLDIALAESVGITIDRKMDDAQLNPELNGDGIADGIPFELCVHWLRPYGTQADAGGGANLEDGDCVNDYDVGTVAIPWSDFDSCADEAEYCAEHEDTLMVHCQLACGTCTAAQLSCPASCPAGCLYNGECRNYASASEARCTGAGGRWCGDVTNPVAPPAPAPADACPASCAGGCFWHGTCRNIAASSESVCTHQGGAWCGPPTAGGGSGRPGAGGTGTATGNPECWSGDYTFQRCCNTRIGPQGDTSCWSKSFDFGFCCSAPGGGGGGH
jgi:hypothetical protein